MLWLGRAVSDVLQLDDDVTARQRDNQIFQPLRFPDVEQNDSRRRHTNTDKVRHHTGALVFVKLAELRRI